MVVVVIPRDDTNRLFLEHLSEDTARFFFQHHNQAQSNKLHRFSLPAIYTEIPTNKIANIYTFSTFTSHSRLNLRLDPILQPLDGNNLLHTRRHLANLLLPHLAVLLGNHGPGAADIPYNLPARAASKRLRRVVLEGLT